MIGEMVLQMEGGRETGKNTTICLAPDFGTDHVIIKNFFNLNLYLYLYSKIIYIP